MGPALTKLSEGLHGYWNASIPLDDTASSSSSPLALVSVGRDINHSVEAAGYDLPESAMYSRRRFLLELAEVLPHFVTRSSGRPGRNGVVIVDRDLIESLVLRWCRDYELEAQWRLDYDLEAGGQAHRVGDRHTGGGTATPVQELSEVAKIVERILVQSYGAFLPACVTALPLVKDAPDHVKFTIFGGLAFVTVGLFVGILSKSVARRRLAVRLVAFSAIAVLTFSVASQLSSWTFIALTALVGLAVNLVIMLLPF